MRRHKGFIISEQQPDAAYRSVREAVTIWGAFFAVSTASRLWADFGNFDAIPAIALITGSVSAWVLGVFWWIRFGRGRFPLPDKADGVGHRSISPDTVSE